MQSVFNFKCSAWLNPLGTKTFLLSEFTNYLRFFILYFCDYVYIYVMILGFLFFIQTFLKHCKALSTEKYKCYINILLLLFTIIIIKVSAGIASRILRACKPPHHMKVQHLGKTCISGLISTSAEKTYCVSESLRVTPKLQFLYCLLGNKTSVISHTSIKINRKTARITQSISGSNVHLPIKKKWISYIEFASDYNDKIT